MLMNLRDVKIHLILLINAPNTSVTNKGGLRGHGSIWYHRDSLVNILVQGDLW